ncbi:MAG TPA: hypothetical protein VEW04_08610 [Allosphingosinicella sp.]|nr:hypothetical protein [Allosphingosinicella sp.]
MRSVILLCAGAALLAGCTSDGNVYAMPVGDVYAKLANFRPEPSGTGPFGRLSTNVTGSGGRQVVWSASGSHGGYRCTATLVPVETEQTRIDLSCGGGGPSSGAAAGLEANMIRKAVIEMIDAKLSDRPYDPQRAQGSTAAFWPADVVDHGDIRDATAKAIEMDREARAASGR